MKKWRKTTKVPKKQVKKDVKGKRLNIKVYDKGKVLISKEKGGKR